MGRLIYRRSEQSFTIDGPVPQGFASLLVNDIQLEVDEAGRVLYAWGYCPQTMWRNTPLSAPAARPSAIVVRGVDLRRGMSYRLTEPAAWPVFVALDDGTLCVGRPETDEAITAHTIGPGVIVTLHGRTLVALWLRFATVP